MVARGYTYSVLKGLAILQKHANILLSLSQQGKVDTSQED